MTYYRVKKEYDNVWCDGCRFLVKNELYTQKEVERFRIPEEYLVKVEEKESETFFVFGARFSYKVGHNN